MNERFNGKVAIVMGAASGIGRAVAERFFKEGASVFAVDDLFCCSASTLSLLERSRARTGETFMRYRLKPRD
jgi:short chain dehydrogenase